MDVGLTVRSMGVESTPTLMAACARLAEQANIESLWVVDHIAIPPDDAEGSGGRYLDPLTSLAWLAAQTTRIRLASGVLILPYRPPLPTIKQIATIQELSGERLIVGAGIGWMQPEFTALGLNRSHRGRDSDAWLEFYNTCFGATDDVVEQNGQPFLFRPRPARPPVLIGGAAPHALQRAVRYADGWLPMAQKPEKLAPKIVELQALAAAAGRPAQQVTVLTGLPIDDSHAAADLLAEYAEVGVDRVVHAARYADASAYAAITEALAQLPRPELSRRP